MAVKKTALNQPAKAAVKSADTSGAAESRRARIRMYRVGLGDCFLLTFFKEGEQHHVLIDCGMFAGSRLDPDAKEKDLQLEIVNHIAEATGGHIDAVVITHEHMDHVSIFNFAKDVFDAKVSFGEAWFGWLEDPHSKVAADLREKYEGLKLTLGAALKELQRLAVSNPDDYEQLHGGVARIAEFTGLAADGSQIAEQPRKAMDFVKQKAGKGNLRFGAPGDTWEVAGLKVRVLGPPPTEGQLRTMDRAGASYDRALLLGIGEQTEETQRQLPFSGQWRRSVAVKDTGLSFAPPRDGVDLAASLARYNDSHEAWRRIDDQASNSASSLALQMDKYINNTSLALAFEFPDKDGKGDVLLFPGDAQVGNWDSWFDIKKEVFDVPDLLKRTIFYKVGHHGSHNATLKPALEQMTHPKLVAMIPTNEKFAKDIKHWTMPAPNLYKALNDHTGKRLLRNDQGIGGMGDPMKDVDWGGLEKNVTVDRLFIDYFV